VLLTLGFPSAPRLNRLTLPLLAARRTVLQKVRGSPLTGVPQLVDAGFQVLFHSPHGVLFTFPSQYSALSVTSGYLALRGGPRLFPQGFSCPVVLWILPRTLRFRLRGFHPLRPVFPGPFGYLQFSLVQSEPQYARILVWALPGSLAATSGIDVSFFSSGYLDVSVRRVPSACLWIQHTVTEVFSAGFPHSDICGSQPICGSPQLFAAYRVFLRPLVPRHPPRALFCLTVSCSHSLEFEFCFPFLSSVTVLGLQFRNLSAPHSAVLFCFFLGSLSSIVFANFRLDFDFQYSVFKVQSASYCRSVSKILKLSFNSW